MSSLLPTLLNASRAPLRCKGLDRPEALIDSSIDSAYSCLSRGAYIYIRKVLSRNRKDYSVYPAPYYTKNLSECSVILKAGKANIKLKRSTYYNLLFIVIGG